MYIHYIINVYKKKGLRWFYMFFFYLIRVWNGPKGARSRTIQFISMQFFASCSPKILWYNIWQMVLYFIRKVRKEKIWKHVILGKAISVREIKMCIQKLHQTLTTRLAVKQQSMIEYLWIKSNSMLWLVVSICYWI